MYKCNKLERIHPEWVTEQTAAGPGQMRGRAGAALRSEAEEVTDVKSTSVSLNLTIKQ